MDIKTLIGADPIAEYLTALRAQIGTYEYWPQIESIAYETFREFEALPGLNFPLDELNAYNLNDDERRQITQTMTRYLREYGESCTQRVVAQLVAARVHAKVLEIELAKIAGSPAQ